MKMEKEMEKAVRKSGAPGSGEPEPADGAVAVVQPVAGNHSDHSIRYIRVQTIYSPKP